MINPKMRPGDKAGALEKLWVCAEDLHGSAGMGIEPRLHEEEVLILYGVAAGSK